MNALEHVFVEIGHGFKLAAVDIAKGVDELPKAIHVLVVTMKDAPVVRDAILALIAQMKPFISDATLDVAEKGLNLPEDIQTIHDFETLVSYFKNEFLPKLESAYKDEEQAITQPATGDVSTGAPA